MSRGAKNNNNDGTKFLTFMSGNFVQRVTKETNGAVSRVLEKGPNTGSTIYELQFNSYEGGLLDLFTEASEYGKKLNIVLDVSTVEEPDSKVKISLPLSSGPAKGFLSRLPVIDLKKDVCLTGYYIKNDAGKFNSYLVPFQDGKKLTPYFTKDEPKGLPRMQQIKVKGSLVWDDTEQLDFYEDLILQYFGKVNSGATPVIEEEEEEPAELPEPTPTEKPGATAPAPAAPAPGKGVKQAF